MHSTCCGPAIFPTIGWKDLTADHGAWRQMIDKGTKTFEMEPLPVSTRSAMPETKDTQTYYCYRELLCVWTPLHRVQTSVQVHMGSSKQEEASELYVRAGNQFKMAKKWAAAGGAFSKAAELQLKMGSKHEAATQYVEAGNCYRKGDPNEAINALQEAVAIYTDMGRFTIAAKHHITIAEIYETELADMEKAVANYERAADYYKGEESNSSANKCLLKVAQFSAQMENYEKAVEIYEQVAVSCMDNSLLKYSAKDHFFRAAVCHMCMDMVNAQVAVQKYEDMFPAFSDSRECKLVKSLLKAVEEENVDAFTQATAEFDSISRLDQWLTTMLLRVKKGINAEPDLC